MIDELRATSYELRVYECYSFPAKAGMTLVNKYYGLNPVRVAFHSLGCKPQDCSYIRKITPLGVAQNVLVARYHLSNVTPSGFSNVNAFDLGVYTPSYVISPLRGSDSVMTKHPCYDFRDIDIPSKPQNVTPSKPQTVTPSV